MKEVTLITNLLPFLILLSLTVLSHQSDECNYNAFLTGCGRSNEINETSQKYLQRGKYYEQRCIERIEHNKRENQTFQKGPNCDFSDSTEQEITQRLGFKQFDIDQIVRTPYPTSSDPEKVSATVLPTSYSYVALGQVTSVKNQGTCGCCWSFASIAMYESLLLKRGYSYGLSEQASLQCTSFYAPNQRVSDCSGGYFSDPLTYLGKVGAALRSTYPYISGSYGSGKGFPKTSGICEEANRISIGNGTAAIYGPLTATQIKTLLINYGPVMIGVYANYAFTQYSSGVFTGCPANSASLINHAVLLVGYDDSTSSWLVKNQWDSSWGEAGYIRISYSNDCGLSTLVGNVQFSSYNSDPNIVITDKSLLFSSTKHETTVLAFLLSMVLMAIVLQ